MAVSVDVLVIVQYRVEISGRADRPGGRGRPFRGRGVFVFDLTPHTDTVKALGAAVQKIAKSGIRCDAFSQTNIPR